MSQKNDYPIHCPKCQHAFSAALYDAVTLAEEPEAKQALLGNTLNRVLCPECQHDFRIDKALLYNDILILEARDVAQGVIIIPREQIVLLQIR